MCLAQGPQRTDPVRLEPMASLSRVMHSTTEPLRSLIAILRAIYVFYACVNFSKSLIN